MKDELKQRLLSTRKRAAEAARQVRDFDGIPPEELVRAAIRTYILNKYLLDEEPIDDERIDELTKLSIANSLRLDKELLAELDRQSNGCGSASSTVTKKILLYLAVQRDFGVTLPPDKMAYASTLDDIAAIVHQQLAASRGV